ncbi:MAG: hypothetical protein K6F83_00625 [Clostridiales bacterium]|nr:hypothetical protein [Clostridiales bacterium]
MDYLEGLFLGKLWSDTDFENRRHLTLFLLYGIFVDLLVLFSYWTGKMIPVLSGINALKIAIFVILFLACPFICFRYYRMPLWGKILVLLEKLYKHVLMIGFTVSLLLPRLTVKSGDLQGFMIDYLNKTLEKYTEKFFESAGTFATIMGVIMGGLHVVAVFAFWAFVAVMLPGLLYLVYRLLQYGYDYLIARFIIRKFFVRRK